jgi:serine/threonine protein kinase
MGRRIDKYDIAYKLGQGAMGTVYKGIHNETQQEVAIKILSEELVNDEEANKRFKREIRQALQLEHPNVVQSIDTGTYEGRSYYVMEYVEGITLKELLKRYGPLEEYQAIEITYQVIQGLEYASNFGIVHRDIKPDNIMLNSKKVAKISDMGLAKSQDSATKVTVKGTVLGTPQYMSPEQATGKDPVDQRSDIYSLGATLYHMLTGDPPFRGKNPIQILSKVLNSEPTPLREIRPTLSVETEALVQKMMEKKIKNRYQNCSEVKKALELLKKRIPFCELPTIAPPPSPSSSLSSPPPSPSSSSLSSSSFSSPTSESPSLANPSSSSFPLELGADPQNTKLIQEAKLKKFCFSFAPSYEDIQFCKILQLHKLCTREQLIQALNRQEQMAKFGTTLALSEILVYLGLLDYQKKGSIDQIRIQHECLKNDLLFGKIALQYNFVPKASIALVQQVIEKSRREQMAQQIGEFLQNKGWISEEQCQLIVAKQQQLKYERKDKWISQMVLHYQFSTSKDIEHCASFQLHELRQGHYYSYSSILLRTEALQKRQGDVLLRALTRYEIVEIPVDTSLQEQILS